jgi:serine protease Do
MQWTHKKKRKFSGMTWLFIGLLIFFVGAGIFTALIRPNRPGGIAAVARAPRAYVGVDEFEAADGGGATFDNVEPPGSPADLAGLIGGDVITSFDGHPVKDDDELMDLLGKTIIGKPAEVIFIRDGEIKKTTLTPISREELSTMERAFRARPEGRGRFGYRTDRTRRVLVPGTTTFGVQLENGSIEASLPADMAGIKEGDIIVEFDGIPIRTPGELEARVLRAKPYEAVTIMLMREGQKMSITVKLGRQR